MSHQQVQAERAPLGALSLLSLAASQVKPQSSSIPRSAATTSISHSPLPSSVGPALASTTGSTTAAGTIHLGDSTIAINDSTPANGMTRGSNIVVARGSAGGSQPKARRLSSTSQSKRRLNEATAATIQATAVSGFVRGTSVVSNSGLTLAAASLSLSASPPSTGQVKSVQQVMNGSASRGDEMDEDEAKEITTGNGKRKGTIYRCETCSKVYRHPNCLLKHRWEHSPHWREASKFLLSKHQQVQLLEAAAILSHLSPKDAEGNGARTSLPEDRSLWPSYLSGGLLPAPSTKTPKSNLAATRMKTSGPPPPNAMPPIKRESSSEEDPSTSRSKDSGYSSGQNGGDGIEHTASSLPPSMDSGAPLITGRSISDQTPGRSQTEESTNATGYYYGSVGAIPTPATTILSPPGLNGGPSGYTYGKYSAKSLQPHYLMSSSSPHDAPPYAKGRPHRRTSSSVSSSYTRSSVRGGDDEDDEDDAMDEDVGYLSPVSPGYSSSGGGGGFGFGALALSPNLSGSTTFGSMVNTDKHATIRGRGGRLDDLDFHVLYERDEGDGDAEEEDGEETVDEDSADDNHAGGGAGMEIDMDL